MHLKFFIHLCKFFRGKERDRKKKLEKIASQDFRKTNKQMKREHSYCWAGPGESCQQSGCIMRVIRFQILEPSHACQGFQEAGVRSGGGLEP